MKVKFKIRLAIILPLLAIPIYLGLLFLMGQEFNAINDDDGMAYGLGIIGIISTVFLGWIILSAGLFEKLQCFLNPTLYFILIVVTHYFLLGLLADLFWYSRSIKNQKNNKVDQEIYQNMMKFKMNKNLIQRHLE